MSDNLETVEVDLDTDEEVYDLDERDYVVVSGQTFDLSRPRAKTIIGIAKIQKRTDRCK